MEPSFKSTFEHAKSMFSQGNFNACSKELHSLINEGYEVAACHYYLGLIYLNLKRYDEAVKELSNCIKIEPQNQDCLFYLGVTAEEENNQDLALHYYYKVNTLNPNHKGAAGAIKRLQQQPDVSSTNPEILTHSQTQTTQKPSVAQDTSRKNKQPDPREETDEPLDLYSQLQEATDKDSIVAVKMIKATQIIKRRPRLRAYLGTIFFRMFIIAILSLIISMVVMHSGPAEGLIIFVVVMFFYLIYKIIKVKSTIVTIDRGLLQLTSGVLSRTTTVYFNHKVDHFGVHQGLFQRITGDCSLMYSIDIDGKSHFVYITGIGRVKEIKPLAVKLQNLRLQLRNTPVIRSGIYG